jgi:hypothetical protein
MNHTDHNGRPLAAARADTVSVREPATPDELTGLPKEVNQRFLSARAEVTAALKVLADANGVGTDAQYQALADGRHKVAQVYREARAVDSRTALDQTLWFALDEAALWQDQEAVRYGSLSDDVPEPGSRSE